ncbi:CsiV family protein [Pseudomonas oligotrophica]|uniref:CsiV family protein n=1 Tax=Pseudomonas oligotrophica TaxID=2912055 RepID=UPI001F4055EA|nr:CsiV family protein [Pseudomonas oligotrophica]MCF7202260.1 peptidoglycan binding protein CsiV [Pseudomonas oligotrophica]
MRLSYCIALLAVLVCSQAPAAEQHYRVELILFRQGPALAASQPAPAGWANGARLLGKRDWREPALLALAARLTPDAGYQVLLHRAWRQPISEPARPLALVAGPRHYEHYPVQGTLRLHPGRYQVIEAEFWINRFGAYGELLGSERFASRRRLEPNRLNFLDNQGLGLLIRVMPL